MDLQEVSFPVTIGQLVNQEVLVAEEKVVTAQVKQVMETNLL